jgi:integrase
MTQFTSLMARNFLRNFGEYSGKITDVTRSKYLYRLKKFWNELKIQGFARENVWSDHIGKTAAKPDDERERAFTMDEVRRLLMGGAPPRLHDLIMIGLLTGARFDAIVCLKVANIGDDYIIFNRQKRETGDRAVPMHPLLKPILARRTANRGLKDDVFPEWPAPKRAESLRERSFKASNAFTAYRQKPNVNVHDQLPGARRSRVNFHSCRRWFITHFRRTASLHLTRAVVGHSQISMTDRIYAGGPLFEAAKPKLFQMELPTLSATPVKEPRGINLYEYLKLSIDDPNDQADG